MSDYSDQKYCNQILEARGAKAFKDGEPRNPHNKKSWLKGYDKQKKNKKILKKD